jgi:hypothetical protein
MSKSFNKNDIPVRLKDMNRGLSDIKFRLEREDVKGHFNICFNVLEQHNKLKFFSFSSSEGYFINSQIAPGIYIGSLYMRGCECQELDGKMYWLSFKTSLERDVEYRKMMKALNEFAVYCGSSLNEYKPNHWEIRDGVLPV